MSVTTMELRKPSLIELPSYTAALERGWSPDTMRAATGLDELVKIAADSDAFVASMEDREGRGDAVTLPDGTLVKRLPGFRRWLWDGEFCGAINIRWQSGTSELPPHVLGHVGYSVVPWKRNLGYATRALGLLLPDAKAVGLDFVELTTDPENLPSQRVILANGGRLRRRFFKSQAYGGGESLLFRIDL